MTNGIGIGQLVSELQRRGERLPFEVGAFVALEACEASLRAPVVVGPDDVRVSGEGTVSIAAEAQRGEPGQSAESLVSMLAQLLVAAGPGVPPNLLRLVEREVPRDLQRVHDEIEASLIPLNRSASRRVLARLVRESSRPPPARGRGEAEPVQIDAALDELLGIAPQARVLELEQDRAEEPATTAEAITKPVTVPRGVIENIPPPLMETEAAHLQAESLDDAILWPPAEELELPRPKQEILEFTDFPQSPEEVDTVDETVDEDQTLPGLRRRSRARWVFGLAALAAIVAISVMADRGALFWPDGLVVASPGQADRPLATPTVTSAPTPTPPGETGVVRLQVEPADTQLFMFVGRGSVRVSGLALGSPHEFVAFDNGYRSSRAVVPEDASWTTTDGEPLYELAVQSEAAPNQNVLTLGAPRSIPSDELAPDATTGTVRVLTTPPGLKVFRYLGVGEAHTIDGLSVQSGHELLLYHPDRTPSRVVIGPSDWVPQGKTQSVQLKVTLPAQ